MHRIEIDNRTIHFPPSLKDVVVKGDSQSKIFTFKIGRYFDGADLSAFNINIVFENALKQTGRSPATLENVDIDFITFDWVLPSSLSVAEGSVLIAVEFVDSARNYIWKTKPVAFDVANTITAANDAAAKSYVIEKAFVSTHNNQDMSGLSDEHAPVFVSNRTILMPPIEDLVVTGDSHSQVISFVIPRYCENVDLAHKVISVKYVNAKGQGDRSGIVNLITSDDTLTFGWVITSKATIASGTVTFAIEFLGYDDNNEFFCWQTTPAQFTVSSGLHVDSEILPLSPTQIQEWLVQKEDILRRLAIVEGNETAGLYKGMQNHPQSIPQKLSQSILVDYSLPVITFTSGDYLENWIDKNDERVATLEYKYGELYYKAYVKIKPQGSSSLVYPKKNFTINIYEDDSFSTKLSLPFVDSWGAQSKYVLKANWIDPTHSCNIVSAKIAAGIQARYGLFENTPNRGLVDGFPVKVYMNGKPQGIYGLMIPKGDWQFNTEKNNPNHIIMCNEVQSGAGAFRALADETTWSVEAGPKTPETWNKFNRLVSFIKDSSDEDFRQHFNGYLNLDACLNYYVIVYYGTAIDNLGKNMLMVTYDGQVWSPSLYDLDALWGVDQWGTGNLSPYRKCPEEYECADSLLWEKIVRVFGDELAQRATELQNDYLNVGSIVGMFEKHIMNIDKRYYDEDLQIWPGYQDKIRSIPVISDHIYRRFPYANFHLRNKASTPDYIVGEKLYELNEPFVGDGARYIDTGIKLYDNPEKEWTLIATIQNKQHDGSDDIYYLSGYSERGNWRGFFVRKDGGSRTPTKVNVSMGPSHDTIVNTGTDHTRLIIRKVKDVADIITSEGYQTRDKCYPAIDPVMNTLLIGATYNGDDNVHKISPVTVNSLVVYSEAITDATLATMV